MKYILNMCNPQNYFISIEKGFPKFLEEFLLCQNSAKSSIFFL